MKKALSLIVALLLALAVIPFGALKASTVADSNISAEPVVDSPYSRETPAHRGFVPYEMVTAKTEPQFSQGNGNKDGVLVDYEYEQLYHFLFDPLDSEVGQVVYMLDGLDHNIDRVYGWPVYDDPYILENPDVWGVGIEDGHCTSINIDYPAIAGGPGCVEGDLDVHDFTSLESLHFVPHYLENINASGCTSLQMIHLSYYDGIDAGDGHVWNDSFYNFRSEWNPVHHMEVVDLTNCSSLQQIVFSECGLETLILDGAITPNLIEFALPCNQVHGEMPDMSKATNLQWFWIDSNHFTGTLTLDSEALYEVCTMDSPPFGYGNNWNQLSDINIVNSVYGAKHFGTENGYVEMVMGTSDYVIGTEVLRVSAFPEYPGTDFLGWFDREGNLFSSDVRLILDSDLYEQFDLTAVFTLPEEYQFESGCGTEGDPYIIATVDQLVWFSGIVGKGVSFEGEYVKLANDLELNDTTDWELWGSYDDNGNIIRPENEWMPIGQRPDAISSYAFCGTFDGDGHTISGLYTNSDNYYGGLFCELFAWAEVKNVTIDKSYFKCYSCTGAIAGYVYYYYYLLNSEECACTIRNCTNYATVESISQAAGILGWGSGIIEKCANFGKISGNVAAGISSVFQSYNEYNYGGPVSSETRNCFNAGDVIGTSSAGGVISTGFAITLENCYNAGIVSSNQTAGAIVADCNSSNTSSGNCYYLDSCGADDPLGIALSDEEMQTEESYVGFDFDNIWIIDPATDYPYAELRSQYAEPEPEPMTGIDINTHEATLEVGDSIVLNAIPIPENATDYEFVWHIDSDEDAATLNTEYGSTVTVTATAPGTADVTLIGIYHGVNENGDDWDYLFIDHCIITVTSAGDFSPGDLDMDGNISVTDALLALRYAMGIIELTPEQVALADVDGSGTVTVTDAVIILRMAMGII